jgi:hypothetical protein
MTRDAFADQKWLLERIDILKLDIQGAEHEAFEGRLGYGDTKAVYTRAFYCLKNSRSARI